jgi:hypothetical protein
MAEALGIESGAAPILVERSVPDDQLPVDEIEAVAAGQPPPKVH